MNVTVIRASWLSASRVISSYRAVSARVSVPGSASSSASGLPTSLSRSSRTAQAGRHVEPGGGRGPGLERVDEGGEHLVRVFPEGGPGGLVVPFHELLEPELALGPLVPDPGRDRLPGWRSRPSPPTG